MNSDFINTEQETFINSNAKGQTSNKTLLKGLILMISGLSEWSSISLF